jgi:hypothetical protein
VNYYQNQQMMDRFFPRQTGGGAAAAGGDPFLTGALSNTSNYADYLRR